MNDLMESKSIKRRIEQNKHRLQECRECGKKFMCVARSKGIKIGCTLTDRCLCIECRDNDFIYNNGDCRDVYIDKGFVFR